MVTEPRSASVGGEKIKRQEALQRCHKGADEDKIYRPTEAQVKNAKERHTPETGTWMDKA
jgi:hypothetical protein